MADISIGVVGLPGKWSTEKLADAVEGRTGKRLVVDMAEVSGVDSDDPTRVEKGAYLFTFTDWRQMPATTDAMQWAGWTWRGIVCSTGDMTWPSWMC